MPTWSKLNLLDSSSPIMEQMTYFHDHTMMILVMILTTVGYMLGSMMMTKQSNKYSMEHQTLETLWTLIPAIILIFIAMPSLKILYMTDETENPNLTLKSVGHQWYWSYELPDFKKEFDSYMEQTLENKKFRLLDVDNQITLPINTPIRTIVTATDVIHSWTIPSMGLKMDALPGRLNQSMMMSKLPGMFYGQCSEICGANHSFMPISLEMTTTNIFLKWIKNI